MRIETAVMTNILTLLLVERCLMGFGFPRSGGIGGINQVGCKDSRLPEQVGVMELRGFEPLAS